MSKLFAEGGSRRRRAQGQSLVETAMLLPLLSLMLIGIVEFGFLLYAHVQVANAAREAARAASLYNSTRYTSGGLDSNNDPNCEWTLQQTIQQAIVYRALNTSGSSKGCPDSSGSIVYTSLGRLSTTVTYNIAVTPAQSTYSGNTPTPGTTGTVTLTYPYQMPIISNLIPFLTNPITIRKSVQYEYQQ
jgi:Flp pilus assembly protein TadG